MGGFTLIEMAVAVGVIGLILSLSIPFYRVWIQNSQTRSVAESMLDGLRYARAEAIRRNTPIRFQIATTGCALSQSQVNWVVSRDDIASPGGHCKDDPSESTYPRILRSEWLQARNPFVTLNAYVIDVSNNPTVTTVKSLTFTPLGTVSEPLQGGGRLDFSNSSLTAAEKRDLRVTVTQSGQLRMCDPSPLLSSDDPRRCF
jgi:type IV fimbrial biogenesis protein FimT